MFQNPRFPFLLLGLALLLVSCTDTPQEAPPKIQFSALSSAETGLDFTNQIEETEALNYFVHSGFYNGAGLAAGDLNNDGLVDLFFSGNQVQNELYLNQGDLQFTKITEKAGIAGDQSWCSGATMVDINADGYLDLYVCRYFPPDGQQPTENLLYLNNGDLTFTEAAAQFGIADAGNSVQATFLDYDLDGDLDLYVVNQPTNFRAEKRNIVPPNDWKDSDRLYRNEGNNRFQDVSEEAGVLNFAYGLCAVAGDINQDGYPDLFVSNDYEAPDHLYLNTQKGGFQRVEDYVFQHISNYSMGADLADMNNDGALDLFVADMLAEEHYRAKANMGAMNEQKFNEMVAAGMHYQYMRNMLHLNTQTGYFSEIGQMAGVSRTDWSWAALFADFDNDGWKDLFVTNGILRDVRNNDAQKRAVENTLTHTQSFPSQPLPNVMFHNRGNLHFEKSAEAWGLGDAGFSNGAVYADLDNDGDLDLVTSNVNAPASLYRNNASGNAWLQIELKGNPQNPRGRGAKVTVFSGGESYFQENTLERGYMSGMSGLLHFGLGEATSIEKIVVVWPGGKQQTVLNPQLNQRRVLRQEEANETWSPAPPPQPVFIPRAKPLGIAHKHLENPFSDFEKQVLLPHKLSTFGPGITVGDVNGDGADDFYIGGAAGQPGALYVKQGNGKFAQKPTPAFLSDQACEDQGVLLFDADGDADLDLYVVSGGNAIPENDPTLQDRLYLNDGQGNFQKSPRSLPPLRSSGSCVLASDFDQDGDLDLFVGGRHVPGKYPRIPTSYLLENNQGTFTDVTEEKAPGLQEIGMVSGGLWSDVDQDGQTDLLVVGEWMPVTVFKNRGGQLTRDPSENGLAPHKGWWNSIAGGDFDKDGDIDYIVGNQGLNTKFHVSPETPLELYGYDFDSSNSLDIVLAKKHGEESLPVRGRECSSQQIPEIEEKFENYHEFASASLVDIYTEEKLKQADYFQATTFATSLLKNKGNGAFEVIPLPIEAQVSAVFGIVVNDFNLDGHLDVLLTGNFYAPEVETGRQDASLGLLLNGDGKGGLIPQSPRETGFLTPRDARSLALLYADDFPLLLVGNNDAELQAFNYVQGTGAGDRFQPGETYAEIRFKDGSTQRIEKYLGSGYFSSSTGFIQIGPETEKLVFFRADGSKRE